MLGQQRSPSPPAGWPGLRRSARTCVLQQARSHSPAQRRSAAGAYTSSGTQSGSLSDASSLDEDSDAQSWASDEEAGAGPHPSSRRQHSTSRSRGPPVNAPAADLSAAAAEPPADMKLHKPYSPLLLCETLFGVCKRSLRLSSTLCTDLADLHSQGSCAAQVSVEVHPSGWDASEDCRAYVMQQQQQQQQQPPASLGPFPATLKQQTNGLLKVTALSHDSKLAPYSQNNNPYTIVLQERVPQAAAGGPPHFRLHIQPGSPAKPRNSCCQAVSRAGEGKGLQVLPGSVTEVAEVRLLLLPHNHNTSDWSWHDPSGASSLQAGRATRDAGGTQIVIPSVLVCSQLPRDAAAFPLGITVGATEQAAAGMPDRQLGQWENHKLYMSSNRVVLRRFQPLAAYAGRRIARLSLLPHQDSYRLSVMFAPPPAADTTPPAAAAAAAAGGAAQPAAVAHAMTAAPAAAAAAPAAEAAAGLDITAAAQSTGAQAAAAPAAAGPATPSSATAALRAFATTRTGQDQPSAQAGSTAAAGGGAGGGSVSTQGNAPAAVGLLPGQAGSGPAATPASSRQALLLPRKRLAAELQQPAAARAAAAGRDSGSDAATSSVLLNAAMAGAAAGAASKKVRVRRPAGQQVVPPAAAGDGPRLGQTQGATASYPAAAEPLSLAGSLGPSAPRSYQAAAAAAAGGDRVLLVKQEPLAAGAHSRLPGPMSSAQPGLLPPKQPAGRALVQNAGGGVGGSAGPIAAAAAGVGAGPVCIKQEPPAAADVMDLTADSDGEGEGEEQQHQQAAAPLAEVAQEAAAPGTAMPLAAAAAFAATNRAPAAGSGGAVAANPAAAVAASSLLPPSLQLPPASSAAEMEEQLADLMAEGLRPLLKPPERYSSLVEQLGAVFGRHMRGTGASYRQLQTMYVFVQAAVDGRDVGKVVRTLEVRLGRLA